MAPVIEWFILLKLLLLSEAVLGRTRKPTSCAITEEPETNSTHVACIAFPFPSSSKDCEIPVMQGVAPRTALGTCIDAGWWFQCPCEKGYQSCIDDGKIFVNSEVQKRTVPCVEEIMKTLEKKSVDWATTTSGNASPLTSPGATSKASTKSNHTATTGTAFTTQSATLAVNDETMGATTLEEVGPQIGTMVSEKPDETTTTYGHDESTDYISEEHHHEDNTTHRYHTIGHVGMFYHTLQPKHIPAMIETRKRAAFRLLVLTSTMVILLIFQLVFIRILRIGYRKEYEYYLQSLSSESKNGKAPKTSKDKEALENGTPNKDTARTSKSQYDSKATPPAPFRWKTPPKSAAFEDNVVTDPYEDREKAGGKTQSKNKTVRM
ncbi:unnamed protein product [Haemonchus placei]|uniref:EGF-like domain-containing protein n=1 Tax=Haemonchus placei TaxID=6290 RepID=A0A0N4X0B9_HAEPC|nr:unnamed protein product [Haemonchus placei]